MDLQGVMASQIEGPAGQFSFDPPIHGLYILDGPKIGLLNRVAFDGKKQDNLFFRSLSCVLLSHYETTKWLYEGDAERTMHCCRVVWYFILLVETAPSYYRRVGIGAKFGHRPLDDDLVTKTLRIE